MVRNIQSAMVIGYSFGGSFVAAPPDGHEAGPELLPFSLALP